MTDNHLAQPVALDDAEKNGGNAVGGTDQEGMYNTLTRPLFISTDPERDSTSKS